MTSKHQKYLNFLADVAKDHEGASRTRVVALIVHKNYPICLGRNQNKSHPIQAMFGRTLHHCFLHSEIDVILKALRYLTTEELKKCTLYVCRILKNGKQATAKPCPGCQKAIKEYNIGLVVWSTEDNNYSTSELQPLNDTNADYELRKEQAKHKMRKAKQFKKYYV